MLIDVGYKTGDTISVRLNTGEEVVATLIEENQNQVTLERPMVVARGPEGLGLIPLMVTAEPDARLTVNMSAVITITKTNAQVASGYTQQVTGLAVPG